MYVLLYLRNIIITHFGNITNPNLLFLQLFRRSMLIKLKDVDKVNKSEMTPESKLYIQRLVVAQKPLKIVSINNVSLQTS